MHVVESAQLRNAPLFSIQMHCSVPAFFINIYTNMPVNDTIMHMKGTYIFSDTTIRFDSILSHHKRREEKGREETRTLDLHKTGIIVLAASTVPRQKSIVTQIIRSVQMLATPPLTVSTEHHNPSQQSNK